MKWTVLFCSKTWALHTAHTAHTTHCVWEGERQQLFLLSVSGKAPHTFTVDLYIMSVNTEGTKSVCVCVWFCLSILVWTNHWQTTFISKTILFVRMLLGLGCTKEWKKWIEVSVKSSQRYERAHMRVCVKSGFALSVTSALLEVSWTLPAASALSKTKWHHHYWAHHLRLRSISSDLLPSPPISVSLMPTCDNLSSLSPFFKEKR